MAMLQLVLLFFQVPSILAICSFPDFLTTVPYWEGQIQNEHYRPDQLLTFRGDTMRMNIYWPKYQVRFLKCHSVQKDNRFILVDTSEGQPTYKCMQFLKRSPYVMQTAESRISKLDNPSICGSLKLSLWPFVYPVLRDVYVDCPRIGGYDMYMFTYEDGKLVEKCDPFIPARLESECMPGEGMVFNFQHHDCVDEWSMSINQEALCLGSWTDDNFTFVVLHNKAESFAKIWMLRLPSTPSEYFRAYLIKDIVADTNTTIALENQEKYIAINMQRRVMKSLCQDESPKCNNSCTSDTMKNYCFRSCKVCQDTKLPNCTMRPDSLGLWYDSSISGTKLINITNDTVYIDKMPPLNCVDLSHGYRTDDSGYRSLVSIFENGCFPRFSCGSFERHSNSIQNFGLSQPVTPTATSILLTGDVCFPLNFRPDNTPLKDFYRSTEKKSLVLIPKPNTSRPLVRCGLQGPLEANVTYASGINCTARILNCHLTNNIVWQVDTECAEPGPRKVVYNCLESYSILTKAFIITERQDNNTDLHCWVYNDDVYRNSPNKLFIMRPADCNLHSMNDIQYSGFKIYESKISFQFALFSSIKECEGVVPSHPNAGDIEETNQATTLPSEDAPTSKAMGSSMDSTTKAKPPIGAGVTSILDEVSSDNYGAIRLIDDKHPPGQHVLSTSIPSKDSVTKASRTILPDDRATKTVTPSLIPAIETTVDIVDMTVSYTQETELQGTDEETTTMMDFSTQQPSAESLNDVTFTSLPNAMDNLAVTDALSTSEIVVTTAQMVRNTEDTTLPEESTDARKMTRIIELVTQPDVQESTYTILDDQTKPDRMAVTKANTNMENRLDKTTSKLSEINTEAVTEVAHAIIGMTPKYPTEATTTMKMDELLSTSAVSNPSTPPDQTIRSLEKEYTYSKSTADNLRITETATDTSDMSSIDVTSESPVSKAPLNRTGKPSPQSDMAGLSEVISLTDGVQAMNITVINRTSDITHDKITAGTQPTKFRAAGGDNFGRPDNAVLMDAVTSASPKLTSCSALFIYLISSKAVLMHV